MSDFDYTLHYSAFHDVSEMHADQMASYISKLIVKYLPSDLNAKIVDVGCGFGFALLALKQLGYHDIQGVEISSQQAAQCRSMGFNVEVTENTIEWISTKKNTFDCVLIMDVIEHVPVDQQIQMMASIRASLKEGGRVILTTPNANAILANRWRYIDFTHHSSFTEHSLNFVLKNAGFTKIMIDNSKGLNVFPKRIWKKEVRNALRKIIVRWLWLQVFKAELTFDEIQKISFDLNLLAVAE